MKRQFSMIAAAIMLLAGVTSCNKDNGGTQEPTGKGTMQISLNLPTEIGSKASPVITGSGAKPATKWANISRGAVLLTQGGVVKGFYPMTVNFASATDGAPVQQVLTNVVAGEGAAADFNVYVALNQPSSWTLANTVGQNLSALKAMAAAEAAFATSGIGNTDIGGGVLLHTSTGAFKPVEEMFIGVHGTPAAPTAVTITDGATVVVPGAISCQRAVSIFRVRIDHKSPDLAGNVNVNNVLTFGADAEILVRRAKTEYNLGGTYAYTATTGAINPSVGTYSSAVAAPITTNALFVGGANTFKTANPAAADYTNPNELIKTGSNYDVTLWNDFLIFPGGSATTNADKFDIVIKAKAPIGYTPQGATTPLVAETPVYFSGQVQQAVGPNQILEVNIHIFGAGSTTPPTPGVFGNLTLDASIMNWGDIIDEQLPM